LNSEQLSRFIAELSLAKKAEDIIIMDLKKLISFTDYFVICSADSDSQVKAISDHITEELKKQQVKVWHVEGYQASTWILIDLVDVVVHIFRPEVRKFYALEKLWGDAKITRVADQ
jgi:ribosome-associated protein